MVHGRCVSSDKVFNTGGEGWRGVARPGRAGRGPQLWPRVSCGLLPWTRRPVGTVSPGTAELQHHTGSEHHHHPEHRDTGDGASQWIYAWEDCQSPHLFITVNLCADVCDLHLSPRVPRDFNKTFYLVIEDISTTHSHSTLIPCKY